MMMSTPLPQPKVFSTSYGEDEDSWSYAAAARLNVEVSGDGTEMMHGSRFSALE